MNNYLNIFARSPIEPLRDHMAESARCVHVLVDLLEAARTGDQDAVVKHRAQIENHENQADEIKNSIRTHLPRSIFMPVPRVDLLELLLVQDRVANRARDVSGVIVGRRMTFPDGVGDAILELGQATAAAVDQAEKVVQELGNLFETALRGAEAEYTRELVDELSALESHCDKLQIAANAKIFDIEDQEHAVKVMFLYRVVQLIGEIADNAERVGRRLEILLAN